MKSIAITAACCLALWAQTSCAREVSFDAGWKFINADPPGAELRDVDDTQWESVDTPHDWAIAGPFDERANGYAGKLPWRGVGWYRKAFTLDSREQGSRIYLDFDGVMAAPKVYINGQLAGEWDYGYTPFRVDLTDKVRFGQENLVAVRVDTTRVGTRWYPGAGIYRKVKLVVSSPVHLARHGTSVTTPKIEQDAATVTVWNEIDNQQDYAQPFSVRVRLRDPRGETVAESSLDATALASGVEAVRHEFHIKGPQRWDIESPRLYRAETELSIEGRVVERRVTPFGVREFRFTADDGFWLNGRRVELRGVNLHHDLGPLGAAFNRAAAERQLRIMQEMGVNAIRTAHNPSAEEVLDLCDELGLLVWDELFDKWDSTSGRVDGAPAFEAHVARHASSLLRRDRNHPSVVVWSIGNEIVNQPHEPEGKSRARIRFARSEFLRHDQTRPVGLGCFIPDTARDDTLADLDVTGWNYQRRYGLFRERFPQTPILYSESASTVSTRGFYELPLPANKCEYAECCQVSAYELSSAAWADIPEIEFERMRRDSFVAGEFVWTGFDYLGEPTPFPREARSSYFGIVDLVGLPKDRYYLYRSIWRPDTPTVHIAPHWNWPDRVGKNVPVFVYTNGDSAELFLNGRSLGKRVKGSRPPTPTDLAEGAKIIASSQFGDSAPELVVDGIEGAWEAAVDDDGAWLQLDLGRVANLHTLRIDFPEKSKLYGYRVLASTDGEQWRELDSHTATIEPRWGGVNEAIHRVEAAASMLRIAFDECLENAKPALEGVGLYESAYQSDYYLPTYDYRLRWDEVEYEPGALRAVAYQGDKVIGEATVETAGEPARLLLESDKPQLSADGDDMAFVTVTAVDSRGVPCPLAENDLSLSITGAARIAAADAGNPLSLDPLQDNRVQLFHGKAVVYLRSVEASAGPAELSVEGEGLPPATLTLQCELPERPE